MQNMSIRIPDSWAHVGAFFQNLGHITPLFQKLGLSIGPDSQWWLPALTHLAEKDLQHAGLNGLPSISAPDIFSFVPFGLFSFEEPLNYLTIEHVYQGLDLDSILTSRDDGTHREDFTLDGEVVATRYTNASADVPWSNVTNFYDDGVRTRKLTEYEDGSLREDTFVDGLRVKTIQQDDSPSGSEKLWFSIDAAYDDSGQLLTRETEYDDGTLRTETFQDGLRASVTQDDTATDVRDWTEISTQYEPNGNISQRTTIFDNGMERADFYTFGVLSVVTKVDAPNTEILSAFEWSDIIQFHDDNGKMVSRGITYDDGSFRSEDFNSGIRSRIIESDLSDQKSWDTIERLFDSSGALSSRRQVDDSTNQTLMFYSDGKRDERIEFDGDESESWQYRLTIYDNLSGQDTSVTTYDTISALPEDYSSYFGQESLI